MGTKRSPAHLRIITKQLHELIQPLGGSLKGARFLVEKKSVNLVEARRRIKLMEKAGVKGVTRNLGASKTDFKKLIARKSGIGIERLSVKQRESYKLLVLNGINPNEALGLSTILGVNVFSFKKRFDVLKQKLDKSQYGINCLPEALYSVLIHLDSYRMQKPLRARLLKPIENANAHRILFIAFPQWKKMKYVYGQIEARTILAKVEYLVRKGKMPYEKYLRQYSLKKIKMIAPTIEPINPKLSKWILSRIKKARQEGMTTEEINYVVRKIRRTWRKENWEIIYE